MNRALALVISLALLLCGIAACAEAEAPTFEALAKLDWSFSSGAGGWSTELQIAADGSFTGNYHDSEMGESGDNYPNGTVYICDFSGQMTGLAQVDAHTWSVHIDKVTPSEPANQESIDDGIRYVTADPYGIAEGDDMVIYLPGTPTADFTEEMRMWAHLMDEETAPAELENWFMYSAKNDTGFVGIADDDDATLANPWVDTTPEALKASGLAFGVPEGAKDVKYRWLESDGLAEMQFKLDDDEYCARVQKAELSGGELLNISGIYVEWEHEENITVDRCNGTIALAKTGSEDWVELCQWYDADAQLMYSLSVYTTDPDGLDLTAVAQMVYNPATQA